MSEPQRPETLSELVARATAREMEALRREEQEWQDLVLEAALKRRGRTDYER